MLLDTHVWIWAATEQKQRLGPKTWRLLTKAAAAEAAWISAASIFELTALHVAGRLQLAQPVESWIRESIDRGGLRVVDLSPRIAIDAGLIPAAALADPIDRLLVASARDGGMPLVTRDQRMLTYARSTNLVRVADASL